MGLEHRAENPSLPQAAIRPAVLPRELRVSVFAARLFLAALGTLGVATQPVYAAGVDCKNSQLLVVGVGYVDNPLVPNISGKADPADIVVGSLKEFGVAVIERSDNPSDSNSKAILISLPNASSPSSPSVLPLSICTLENCFIKISNLHITPSTLYIYIY